jgi:hypothetical protein
MDVDDDDDQAAYLEIRPEMNPPPVSYIRAAVFFSPGVQCGLLSAALHHAAIDQKHQVMQRMV